MTAMPHLSSMIWNHDDELQKAVAGSESVYFQYAGGIRSRKYTEKSGTTTEERIYLGPFEIYRKRVNGSLNLERESLHMSDGTGRICIVETKTVDGGSAVGSPTGIWRYQLGNHLGSAATEVDATGAVIRRNEYFCSKLSSVCMVWSAIPCRYSSCTEGCAQTIMTREAGKRIIELRVAIGDDLRAVQSLRKRLEVARQQLEQARSRPLYKTARREEFRTLWGIGLLLIRMRRNNNRIIRILKKHSDIEGDPEVLKNWVKEPQDPAPGAQHPAQEEGSDDPDRE